MKILAAFLIALALLSSGLAYLVSNPIFESFTGGGEVKISKEKLRQHVEALSTIDPPRNAENMGSLEKASDYIWREFESMGLKVKRQEFPASNRTYHNLIVKLGPDKGDLIVVGAHYDVAGDTPGADDNASGVASLLELARLLKQATLTQPVELVAYTLEEPPFFRTEMMGSFVHAHRLQENNRKVALMLSLEMLGYYSDEEGSQNYPIGAFRLIYPSKGNFITIAGRFSEFILTRKVKRLFKSSSALPVESINAPSFVPGMDFSDHSSYWKHGFPALMITDTAFYRNERYHQPDDTADTLDYDRMSQAVEGVNGIVQKFSSGIAKQ